MGAAILRGSGIRGGVQTPPMPATPCFGISAIGTSPKLSVYKTLARSKRWSYNPFHLSFCCACLKPKTVDEAGKAKKPRKAKNGEELKILDTK
jgi:hypothetical protein